MDITVYKFSISIRLEGNNNLSENGFMNYLTQDFENKENIYDKERIIVMENIPDSDYIAGVLLSFRNYNAHCRVVAKKGGGYSAAVETIENGVEYNFFIFNKIRDTGLWLTYFNAASISVLDKILKDLFNRYAEDNGIEVNREFKLNNEVSTTMIVSEETVTEALSRFNIINSIEYTEVNTEQHLFLPDTINVKRTKLSFKRNNVIDNTRNSIERLIESRKARNVCVTGKNNGRSERINLDTIFRPYATYDYDEITNTLQNFNTNNLLEHQIVTKLRGLLEGIIE